jgi:hypothetical protein
LGFGDPSALRRSWLEPARAGLAGNLVGVRSPATIVI